MSRFDIAKRIIERLTEAGFTALFAGGWVRDFLLDHPSDDIDIATNAMVDDIERLFPKTIPVGINFGIIIIVEEGHQFETATFRKEEGYKDGRRPTKVEKASVEEDAKRRDFTINGMFYDPINNQILDYVEGKEDLEKGIIRAIGNAHERFIEDRLRMIRAVRYASRFKFSIEEETLKAILDHSHTLFPAVARERIWNEFKKMASYAHFDTALITLHLLNLLPVIFPSLMNVETEEIEKRVARIPEFPEDAPVIAKLLELFPEASLEDKLELCDALKLSNSDRDFITYYHESFITLIASKNRERELWNWAHLYAHPLFPMTLKVLAIHLPLDERQAFLQEHHMREKALEVAIGNIQNKTPILNSAHLREAGIENGIAMGKLLKEGERIAINESISDPKAIVAKLKKTALWP